MLGPDGGRQSQEAMIPSPGNSDMNGMQPISELTGNTKPVVDKFKFFSLRDFFPLMKSSITSPCMSSSTSPVVFSSWSRCCFSLLDHV